MRDGTTAFRGQDAGSAASFEAVELTEEQDTSAINLFNEVKEVVPDSERESLERELEEEVELEEDDE